VPLKFVTAHVVAGWHALPRGEHPESAKFELEAAIGAPAASLSPLALKIRVGFVLAFAATGRLSNIAKASTDAPTMLRLIMPPDARARCD
jgi:hypothetical protein